MNLSQEQKQNLLTEHAYRVCSSMDPRDLISYAVQMYCESFMLNESKDFDLDALVEDMIDYEGGETREVREFLNSQNLSPETIEAIICDHE